MQPVSKAAQVVVLHTGTQVLIPHGCNLQPSDFLRELVAVVHPAAKVGQAVVGQTGTQVLIPQGCKRQF